MLLNQLELRKLLPELDALAGDDFPFQNLDLARERMRHQLIQGAHQDQGLMRRDQGPSR